jgi:hypothetical protein
MVTPTEINLAGRWLPHGTRCLLCDRLFVPFGERKRTYDHILPRAWGGKDYA